jgi:dTDP-4-amino-4,6-dideoxygalactose transaminase
MKKRIDYLKNFGFAGETTVVAPGINAKMNEFQSALGLLQLKYIDQAIQKRKEITMYYREKLKNIPGISFFEDDADVKYCYPYFPILVDQRAFGKSRDQLYEELKKHNIFGRRYFYPLISQFPTYRGLESAQPGKLPVAEKVAQEVLCLPIFPDMQLEVVDRIQLIIKNQN